MPVYTAVTVTPAHSQHGSVVVSNSPHQKPLQIPIGLMATSVSHSKANIESNANNSVTVSLTTSTSKPGGGPPGGNPQVMGSMGSMQGHMTLGGHHQYHQIDRPVTVLEDREEIIPFSQGGHNNTPSGVSQGGHPTVIVTPAPLNSNNGIALKTHQIHQHQVSSNQNSFQNQNNPNPIDNGNGNNGKVEVTPIKDITPMSHGGAATATVIQVSEAKKAKFE